MFEPPLTREHHRCAYLIAGLNGLIVIDRTPRLDHPADTL